MSHTGGPGDAKSQSRNATGRQTVLKDGVEWSEVVVADDLTVFRSADHHLPPRVGGGSKVRQTSW
jgi:hypothetical protein